LLLVLAVCNGDDHTENVGVEDLRALEALRLNILAASPEIDLEIAAVSTACIRLAPDLRITVGDVPMEIIERGGVDETADNLECIDPRLRLTVPALPQHALVFADHSSSITCPLGSMLAPRTATVDTNVVRAGQDIVVSWSPATDLKQFSVTVVVLHPGAPSDVLAFVVRSDGSALVTVPSTFPAGDYELRVSVSEKFSGPPLELDCELAADVYTSMERIIPLSVIE